jgi:hypothetical protein
MVEMAVQRARPEDYFRGEERAARIFERVAFSVGSIPVIGVPFVLDGVERVTPFVEEALPSVRGLEAYQSISVGGKEYRFKMWDDGVTSPLRKADLNVKKSYVMVYEPVEAKAVAMAEEKVKAEAAAPQVVKAQETSTPQVNYTPLIILGIVSLVIVAICYFGYLSSKR